MERTKYDTVSVSGTYLAFLLGGLFGFHRMWMGRRFAPTLLYAVTGAYLGLGWIYDLFTIPAQVHAINKKLEKLP